MTNATEGPAPILDRARAARRATVINVGRLYRMLLPCTSFVAATGSCGKTTTCALIGTILSDRARVSKTVGRRDLPRGFNRRGMADRLFKVRPWHRYCVQELHAWRVGAMADCIDVLRPTVGVVTHIGSDHYSELRGPETAAREKAILIESLPKQGIAVLNSDDPFIREMAGRTRARVITFGTAEAADVRAQDVSSIWPDPLSLTVSFRGRSVPVTTRLHGEHVAYSVLAAMTCALALGRDLDDCARVIADFEPVFERMTPVPVKGGATFIVDTIKAPLWTLPAFLHFVETARASRKIIVLGTISDFAGATSPKYRRVARQALEIADKVIFVGPKAHHAAKVKPPTDLHRLETFETLDDLGRFLDAELRPGDLVVVKGSGGADNLKRLVAGRAIDRTGLTEFG